MGYPGGFLLNITFPDAGEQDNLKHSLMLLFGIFAVVT
jgi:uncharacterized protein YhhL (DUF1145 family)